MKRAHRPLRSFSLAILLTLAALSGPAPLPGSGQTGTPLSSGPGPAHDLAFTDLAASWDESIPLGNGLVGALVWRRQGALRLSLDRADLWDLRPMANLDVPEWSFRWVIAQWAKDDYRPVQAKFDAPYETEPAPTKIPAGAIEFDPDGFGPVASVRLDVRKAVCRVEGKDGRSLETFVHATKPVGFFKFAGAKPGSRPVLRMPPFGGDGATKGASDSVTGQDLRRLGYEQGRVEERDGLLVYHQSGWGGFSYDVAVAWSADARGGLTGAWSVTSSSSGPGELGAAETASAALKAGYEAALASHRDWWEGFWGRASVRVPDPVLEKQWFLETYKFGSAARRGAPPISLQAVWTADNGKLPPWKGDFHHDLNTQLSYWPGYAADHLEEGLGYLDWLWSRRPAFKRYTKAFFGTSGLNVPGVSTLAGEPMGGWIQYAFSPTVSAWLAQHFDLHWRYSRDREFLKERAYPWVRDVAVHLDELSVRGADGRRKLPLSSSPEVFDNSRRAWFAETTNYDLALVRWTFAAAAGMAAELGLRAEAAGWRKILAEWPAFAVDPEEGLLVAPGFPSRESHRHFSHLLAFHPLGLLDWSNGPADRGVIRNSLASLGRLGPDWWCGYSYSWLGNMKARAFDGEGAAAALRTFATAFCLPNGFHVNGDQTKTGKSKFTYRPFTLEGNFAFASGLQEMLLQSHSGEIRVFPALPPAWKEASFKGFRAQGAFLVSARLDGGQVKEVRVVSEKGGRLRLHNPFEGLFHINGHKGKAVDGVIEVETKPGDVLLLEFEEE